MDEPMFTYEDLALLDMIVNPAKWELRAKINQEVGSAVMNGGDRQNYLDRTHSDRERFKKLDALSKKVKDLRAANSPLNQKDSSATVTDDPARDS